MTASSNVSLKPDNVRRFLDVQIPTRSGYKVATIAEDYKRKK